MSHPMQRRGTFPDMERVRDRALAELNAGFGVDPERTWAIVGQSGNVYQFGREQHRTEAEDFCSPSNPRDEPLFIFGRPIALDRELGELDTALTALAATREAGYFDRARLILNEPGIYQASDEEIERLAREYAVEEFAAWATAINVQAIENERSYT